MAESFVSDLKCVQESNPTFSKNAVESKQQGCDALKVSLDSEFQVALAIALLPTLPVAPAGILDCSLQPTPSETPEVIALPANNTSSGHFNLSEGGESVPALQGGGLLSGFQRIERGMINESFPLFPAAAQQGSQRVGTSEAVLPLSMAERMGDRVNFSKTAFSLMPRGTPAEFLVPPAAQEIVQPETGYAHTESWKDDTRKMLMREDEVQTVNQILILGKGATESEVNRIVARGQVSLPGDGGVRGVENLQTTENLPAVPEILQETLEHAKSPGMVSQKTQAVPGSEAGSGIEASQKTRAALNIYGLVEEKPVDSPNKQEHQNANDSKTADIREVAGKGGRISSGDIQARLNGEEFRHGQPLHQHGTSHVVQTEAVKSTQPTSPLWFGERARTLLEQVAQGLLLSIQEHRSEVRIRLKPEALGEIVVTVQQEDASVAAQIRVEHAGVKLAIDTQLPHLRQSLLDQGVDVRRLEVLMADQSFAREFREQTPVRVKRRGGSSLTSAEDVNRVPVSRSLGYNTIELIL